MPRILGLGLVALDVVVSEAGERLGAWAGGSCGNVLSILAWLGWEAAPVARLDSGHNAQLVRNDLRRWGVDERWLALGSTTPTPVYIERLSKSSDGSVVHRFDRFCPECGGRLPGYQPVVRNALGPVLDSLEQWQTLYVDRPSAAAVLLAREARERGLLVVFEPSARGAPAHLKAIASSAHIVKYSSDRLTPDDRELIALAAPTLEIETLGASGLRYRRGGDWQLLTPPVVRADDTAGAGDWTSAGLLLGLAERSRPLERLGQRALRETLSFAQALGAWSCNFRGPRGAMEHHTAAQARSATAALLEGDRHTLRRRRPQTATTPSQWACAECR
jgi:sugar/nucleoside kinase (ribokinase family)